ncbi:MAG: biotin/lipoyl-binding protein [Tissierellia bacterium]|nr:biotin/lipoyl-binding protein [Tissierellia bacterium]
MKKFMINVNGNSYEVEVEEVKDGVRQSAPLAAVPAPAPAAPIPAAAPAAAKEVAVSAGQEVVESPMPGTILRIEVKEGQDVKAGDILLILEAMKMENEILAPSSGRVVSIATSAGSSVDTGDKLVVIG